MADSKISQLTAITTIDNANDVLPIVDSSANSTKKVTVAQIVTAAGVPTDTDELTEGATNLYFTNARASAAAPVQSVNGSTGAVSVQETLVSGTNIKTVNSTSLLGSGDISITASAAWGGITGTLSSQTDLQSALDGKVDENAAITGATKTKITYDAKGLVTAGADLAATDLPTGIDAAKIADGSVSNTEFQRLGSLTAAIQQVPAINATSSAPSLAASDDTNTGVNWTLADTLDLVAGGSSKLRINQTGLTSVTVNNSTYVSGTELGYLDGVTSPIQTQIDAKTAKLITTNRQTASYTLALSDADKLVEMNVATANNLTVPLNSSVAFSVGTQILLAQYGAGQTTVVATSGVTIRSNGGKLKLNVQYSGATLIKIATDEWYLFGDIAS